MGLTVLTPTGARPEAFAKCVEQMAAQDYAGRVKWVIVDDGPEAMPTPNIQGWQIVHVRPQPFWKPGDNTQARNMKAGLDFVGPDDKLVVVEDDDAYAPWWLTACDEWLDSDDLVGEAPSVYQHINGNRKQLHNNQHASLCQTALKGKAIDYLRDCLDRAEKFIDIQLWKRGGKLYQWNGGVVGIKGYPGRPGIGVGHRL